MNATECGFCGHDFTGRYAAPILAARRSGSGGLRAFIIITVLVITGGALAIIFMVGNTVNNVNEAFDSVPNFTDAFTQDTGGNEIPGVDDGEDSLANRPGAYKTARALFKDMKANGLECVNFSLITENQTLQAGTCTWEAVPLTIQVFYDDLSYNAVVGNYRTNDAIQVAYGTNWTVLSPTPEGAKRTAKALDGKVG